MSKKISSIVVDDDDTDDCNEWFVLQTSVRSVELDRGLSSGLGFTLSGCGFVEYVKCSCIGDSLAGEVADRFRVLSRGMRPTIFIWAGDWAGNKEYLLAVGEGVVSDRPTAKGGLGIIGDVIRLASTASPSDLFKALSSAKTDPSEVLAFLLEVSGEAQLSAALLRLARRDEDCDALGRLLMMTV